VNNQNVGFQFGSQKFSHMIMYINKSSAIK